jgi:hypothetical protein
MFANGSPAFHCSPVLGGIVESWSYPLVAERPCGNSLRGPVDPQGAERLADQRMVLCFRFALQKLTSLPKKFTGKLKYSTCYRQLFIDYSL